MRSIAALFVATLLAAVMPAAAQPAAADRGAERPRRAPLAVPEDFAPAVDVSRLPAAAPGGGAAPQEAAAPEQPSQPRVAPAAAQASPAADLGRTTTARTIDLGTTSITGNQELPKVLYIVPWKRSDLGELVGRPVNTLLDEVLAPVDPEVFERHLQYYESLFGTREEE